LQAQAYRAGDLKLLNARHRWEPLALWKKTL
jgi:hypothetical protein